MINSLIKFFRWLKGKIDRTAPGNTFESGRRFFLAGPVSAAALAPSFLEVSSDIANSDPVSLLRFIPQSQWPAIQERTSTFDCTTAWKTALSTAPVLYIPHGLYEISGTATPLGTNSKFICQRVYGDGYASEIKTIADIEHLSNLEVASSDVGVQLILKDLKLANAFPVTDGAGATHFHIHLANAFHCLFDRIWCESKFNDTDFNVRNHGGVWLGPAVGGYPNNFMNLIRNSWMKNCQVRFDCSDSEINSSFVWGHPCDYAIQANSGNIRIKNNLGIIGSRSHGGAWLTDKATFAAVDGNFFDGCNVDRVNSGFGIFSDSQYPLSISNNFFWRQYKSAIWMNNPLRAIILGNVFHDNGRNDTGEEHDIVINGISFQPNSNLVTKNQFHRSAPRKYAVAAILERRQQFEPTDNNYEGNVVTAESGQYKSPAIELAAGGHSMTMNNLGLAK